jgi:hypothetical protein
MILCKIEIPYKSTVAASIASAHFPKDGREPVSFSLLIVIYFVVCRVLPIKTIAHRIDVCKKKAGRNRQENELVLENKHQ